MLAKKLYAVRPFRRRANKFAPAACAEIISFKPRLSLAVLALLLWAFNSVALADSITHPAEQRSANVAQVVLGILGYARWPVEPQPLRVCVVGPTEYTDDLLKGPTMPSGTPIAARRLLAGDSRIPNECDAVYIGWLTAAQRSDLFAALQGHAVLSISEESDQCTVGSMFCLQVSDAQVSFKVNLDSVARSGVRVHPSVLQLSRRGASTP